MDVHFEARGGVGLLRIEGRFDLDSVPEFKQRFADLLGTTRLTRFVFDLAKMTAIDSSGLGAIIASLRKLIQEGGDLKIARLPAPARLIFEITKVHRVFAIYDDVDAAIASFPSKEP